MYVKNVEETISKDFVKNNNRFTPPLSKPVKQIRSEIQQNIDVVTPIKTGPFKKFLVGYDQTISDFLLTGFTQGFKIPYQGKRQFRFNSNLKSAKDNMDILLQKIKKEIDLGRAAGPFSTPPFPQIQVSPLGLVPKKNPGEFRVIHHLSYPDNESINDGISETNCTVQYQTVDDAIKLIKFYGKDCLLAKTDIEHSFKIIPIHPSDFELLGFSLEGQYFYDKTLPMGVELLL